MWEFEKHSIKCEHIGNWQGLPYWNFITDTVSLLLLFVMLISKSGAKKKTFHKDLGPLNAKLYFMSILESKKVRQRYKYECKLAGGEYEY